MKLWAPLSYCIKPRITHLSPAPDTDTISSIVGGGRMWAMPHGHSETWKRLNLNYSSGIHKEISSFYFSVSYRISSFPWQPETIAVMHCWRTLYFSATNSFVINNDPRWSNVTIRMSRWGKSGGRLRRKARRAEGESSDDSEENASWITVELQETGNRYIRLVETLTPSTVRQVMEEAN